MEECIFDNLEEIVVPKYYEYDPLESKKLKIDYIKLKIDFFNVYIDNEIFYKNKIYDLQKKLLECYELLHKSTGLLNVLKEENNKLKRKREFI
jgi:hypothetical protein